MKTVTNRDQHTSFATRLGTARSQAILALFAATLLCIPAFAVPTIVLPLQNSGFEDDDVNGSYGIDFLQDGVPSGWELFIPDGSDITLGSGNFIGTIQPGDSNYYQGNGYYGDKACFIYLDGPLAGTGNEIGIRQMLDDNAVPGCFFKYAVGIGNIESSADLPNSPFGGFPGARIQLVAGGTVVHEYVVPPYNPQMGGTLEIPEGEFDNYTFTGNYPESLATQTDLQLEIRILCMNAAVGTTDGIANIGEIGIDSVVVGGRANPGDDTCLDSVDKPSKRRPLRPKVPQFRPSKLKARTR